MLDYLIKMDFHVSPLFAAFIVVVANLLLLLFILRAKSDKRDFALYTLICGDSFILASLIMTTLDPAMKVSSENIIMQITAYTLMFVLGIVVSGALITFYKMVRYMISKIVLLIRQRGTAEFSTTFSHLLPILGLFFMLQVVTLLIQNHMIA